MCGPKRRRIQTFAADNRANLYGKIHQLVAARIKKLVALYVECVFQLTKLTKSLTFLQITARNEAKLSYNAPMSDE